MTMIKPAVRRFHTTAEENEILTRVGPGTPMGELLRRYWWPVALSEDLKDKPTLIRLLGEDLVLFRAATGEPGLIDALCAHRRANLCFGRVNAQGLRCRYHGWLFDKEGNTLETPGELDDELRNSIKQKAYPVEELGGCLWAYMGPTPVPVLPRFHILTAEGWRNPIIQHFNDCNWLQGVENGIDPFHVSFLHADLWRPMTVVPEKAWFERTDYGCIYKAVRGGRKAGEWNYRDHPITMPGVVFAGDAAVSYGNDRQKEDWPPAASARWSVPIDDTHTMHIRVHYRPTGEHASPVEQRTSLGQPIKAEPYKEYKEGRHDLGYTIPAEAPEQDGTILESLGEIVDRDKEHLSIIDDGIVLLRKMLLEQVATVQRGGDPMGVIRNAPADDMIVRNGDYLWIGEDDRNRILQAAYARVGEGPTGAEI
jgi:5,5'-dehydrodivanillate O-demethylase oxygenase subunit